VLLGVDVGGTFTDAVVFDGESIHTAKSPTTPGDQAEGVMSAIAAALQKAGAEANDIGGFVHGMTVGTNALLEEGGTRTALVTTRGFEDLLDIARQNRPHLYRLCEGRSPALAGEGLRFGAAERTGHDGVIESLAAEEAERIARELAESDAEAVAICLLFSYRDPAHERLLAEAIARLAPDLHVSASHEVLAQFREYERCSTTVIDAYLSPLLGAYLSGLEREASSAGLPSPQVMRSSGGTVPAREAARSGAWSVLSGPAGGAVGAGLLASISGDGNTLGFDMGGTSCDVCVVEDGRVRRTDSRELAGRVIQLPMVDVHTVGAGGGSIAWADPGGALRVGPRSAGSSPGPACYGRGGSEPTVTDANLLLGVLDPGSALAGGVELNFDAAREAIASLGEPLGLDETATAEGIVRVANQEMIRALRVVTVERGVDPRDFSLLPFGGAGPMHAAAIAEEMGIERILCPRASGVLSALGLIASERRRDAARTVMLTGGDLTAERLADEVELLRSAIAEDMDEAETECTYELRYRGQSFELPIDGPPKPDPAQLAESFAAEHERRYGYRDPEGEVELATIRVALRVPGPEPRPQAPDGGDLERSRRRVRIEGHWHEAEVLRGEPGAGESATGPCLFELPEATLMLPPGWQAEVDGAGTILASRPADTTTDEAAGTRDTPDTGDSDAAGAGTAEIDAVSLQVLAGALRAACEEMGAVLIRSAHSPNIKERRDCSTALFDTKGELVMQAEHIPVHLGSMPDAVAAIIDREQVPGSGWILNDPYAGGTHLPDITLIRPVFDRDEPGGDPRPGEPGINPRAGEPALLGFAASRAHHADVGGPTPGGMPADSKTLAEEGIVISPRPDDDLSALAKEMRNPSQRLADLRAQQAANLAGERRLRELAERLGHGGLEQGMAAILDYAERRTRAALAELPDGSWEARDVLEGGDGSEEIELRVKATIAGEELRLDFAGSSAQVEGNLNCPLAVTKSASFFAVRAMTDPDAPASAGAHRPVTVEAAAGSLLNAEAPAAVAAGNVETSSRIADLVIAALGQADGGPAQGQGTMNNLTLSGEGFTYY